MSPHYRCSILMLVLMMRYIMHTTLCGMYILIPFLFAYCHARVLNFDMIRYVTVIYNDEVHNFDEVIAQFKELLKSSHSEASAYATSIDREGRMLIRTAGKEECEELTKQFLGYKPTEHSRIRFNKEPLVVSYWGAASFKVRPLFKSIQRKAFHCHSNVF